MLDSGISAPNTKPQSPIGAKSFDFAAQESQTGMSIVQQDSVLFR